MRDEMNANVIWGSIGRGERSGTVRALLAFAALSMLPVTAAAEESVPAIHEWGTFTALQDEEGRAVGGINTDDEPVPAFVHNIAGPLLIPPTQAPPSFFQGAPRCHPDVTMRLETPVLYVHPRDGVPQRLRVQVGFQGGWLTQFYPRASYTAPGINPSKAHFGPLSSATIGKLEWNIAGVDAGGSLPETDEHVWLAPRQVRAATLRNEDGEAERFLFYRGVGHLDAPLRVVRSADSGTLAVSVNPAAAESASTAEIHTLWLAEVRANGTAAFRTLALPERGGPADHLLVTTASSFAESDYGKTVIDRLRAELKTALLADGLFADEAEALLETWKLSYFKSAGLRLFFLVPRPWTEAVLPLQIETAPASPACTVRRVMVGRIELITPRQRQLLRRIAEGPVPSSWRDLRQQADALTLQAGRQREWRELMAGKLSFEQIGVRPPPVYQAYLDLGRFRNALILQEQRRRPSPVLDEFIKEFGLQAYRP
jgi:hypothetical protein